MAGYSGTPLIKKLGIKETMKVQLINAPAGYVELLETDIREQLVSRFSDADFIHIFAISKKELSAAFKQIIKEAKEGLVIWFPGTKNLRGCKRILQKI